MADLDPDIPPQVGSAYAEGMRALSVKAARAAVVMFRGMLAQVVADKGSAAAQAKHSLYDKLEQMSQDGSLHPSLVEWAREIRLIGNAAAHPDALDPVSDEEAADLARLCRQLLNVVYDGSGQDCSKQSCEGINSLGIRFALVSGLRVWRSIHAYIGNCSSDRPRGRHHRWINDRRNNMVTVIHCKKISSLRVGDSA
jgi:hypothetical protein